MSQQRTLVLGPDPRDMDLRLVRGGSFSASFTRTVSETDDTEVLFDADGAVELTIGSVVTWHATISGAKANFSETTAAVTAALNSLGAARSIPAVLWYVRGANRTAWAMGPLSVRG